MGASASETYSTASRATARAVARASTPCFPPRCSAAGRRRGGKQGVEARAPEDRFGTPARHARQRARVLEEVDEALVVEVARQEPPIALHPLGVGEPAVPPLG